MSDENLKQTSALVREPFELESVPGEGATFTVRLPLRAPDA